MSRSPASTSTLRLPVRFNADGGISVDCPLRPGPTPLEACAGCERCQGFTAGPEGFSFVVCDVPPEELVGRGPAPLALETPVSAIMTRDPDCVPDSASAEAVWELFLEEGPREVTVVNERGYPIGLLPRGALRRGRDGRITAQNTPEEADEPYGLPERSLSALDLMTPVVFTLPEKAPLSQAAALMASERLTQLHLLSPRGTVAGVVSAFDIMGWLARQAGPRRPFA
jgi:CBS domain-containing protein